MQILRKFTWWIDSRSLHLECDELTPPAVKDKLEELRLPGAGLDVPLGLEKLESKATLNTENADVLARAGLAPGLRLRSTFRGQTVGELDGVSQTHIHVMEHRLSHERKAWKGGDKAGVEFMLNAITYYKHTIDARLVYEIDLQNMVCSIDGVDQWREAREALGIGF